MIAELLIILSPLVFAENPDPCQCMDVPCSPCESQTSVKFYTEKCDNGRRMKSCKKFDCVPLDPLPAECLVSKKATEQTPPTTAEKELEKKLAETMGGVVKAAQGDSSIRLGLKTEALKLGSHVAEGAIIETKDNAKLRIEFVDGNEIFVQSKTKVQIVKHHFDAASDDRQVQLNLIYGKVRSSVTRKYDGNQNRFEVKTPLSIASVHGTDFVVSFVDNHPGEIEARVESLSGNVELKTNLGVREVLGGHRAGYVVAGVSRTVFDEGDFSNFQEKGYLTSVFQMSKEELDKLESSTMVAAAKPAKASATDPTVICKSPKAQLNDCLWRCQNNPKGEKKCRVNLPKVDCIRMRCNANGKWDEWTRMPSSQEICKGKEDIIAPCDY